MRQEAVERIKDKLERNELTVEDLEPSNRNYEEEIKEGIVDKDINWKVEFVERKVTENIDDIIRNKNIDGFQLVSINNNQVSFSRNHMKQEQASSWTFSTPSMYGNDYLDAYYPTQTRNKEKTLDISNKKLKGSLKLEGFVNLVELNCSKNELTSLDLSDCSNLEKLYCFKNRLTDIVYSSNLDKVTDLDISNNNFPRQHLLMFSKFTNLQKLLIGFNNFYGSLEPLKNLTRLEKFDISNTGISQGLEYLPNSLKKIRISNEEGCCQDIVKELRGVINYVWSSDYDLSNWRSDNARLIEEVRKNDRLERTLVQEEQQHDQTKVELAQEREKRQQIEQELEEEKKITENLHSEVKRLLESSQQSKELIIQTQIPPKGKV